MVDVGGVIRPGDDDTFVRGAFVQHGVVGVSNGVESTEGRQDVTADDEGTTYGAFGYALYELWSQAVERAGTTDGAAVAAELDKFKDVPTIVGETSYTPEVHIALQRPVRIMEIQGGKPQFLEKWDMQEPVAYPTEG